MPQKPSRRWALAAAAVAAWALVACGGSDDAPKVRYSKMVVFGDSLSDVGTYATPGLVRGTGGGKYTVNGAAARIWVEQLAERVGVAAPCAAVVGLEASGAFADFAATPAARPGCTGYAQGGARVSEAIGPWNAALLPDPQGLLGQLTEPVVAQVARHLATPATAGRFASDDLVTVLAGGNDLFVAVDAFETSVANGVSVQEASQTAGLAMGTAGAQLAQLVKTQIVAKGAAYVVVVNLPDVSLTPGTLAAEAATPGSAALVRQLVQAFNNQLAQGLLGTRGVLLVDAYTRSQDQTTNPAQYGIDNITTPACANSPLAGRPVSLFCNGSTVVAADVSRYFFADDVHPTPLGYRLLANYVALRMIETGWL